METTPNDLRQQQFEIKFRGYNPDDVEVFRDLAATALEETRAEVLKLTEENNTLSERLKHLVALEDTLKAAVLESQKNADNTIANARKEAEVTVEQARKEATLIIRDAEQQRETVTADMHRRMGKLVADINKIRFIRSNYLTQLKTMVTTQLTAIEQAVSDDERDAEQAGPPTDPQSFTPSMPERHASDAPVEQADMLEDAEGGNTDENAPEDAGETVDESPSDDEWQDLEKQLNEE